MEPPYFVIYAIDTSDDAPGPPAVEDLTGFNVVNLAFLLTNGEPAPYSQPDQWQKMSASDRAALKTSYEQAGIKLIVSVFGETEKPTTNNADAKETASAVAKWVKAYDLDGVDVDYEDFDAMNAGTAEQWVIDFTSQLYSELGSNYLITHAPIAGWFSAPRSDMPGGGYRTIDQAVGTMINWYNVQFYNDPGYDTTCDNLLHESGGNYMPETALFEINTAGQIPLDKLVLGKPATETDASAGYMDPALLNSCVQEATQNNWSAGIMFWKYSADAPGIMQQARGSAFPLSSNPSSPTGMNTTHPTGMNNTGPTGTNNTDPTGMNNTGPTGMNGTSTGSDTGSDEDTGSNEDTGSDEDTR
ncbi:glycoside hydrolase family 18 protein [Mycena filopes]|nr:glycoside hydrolase family 18 protein [Mycena filopes]